MTAELLKSHIKMQAEYLMDNKIQVSMASFPFLIDAIQQYYAGALQEGSITEEDVAATNGILVEIMHAMEEKDYVLMADLLQYELSEKII